VADTQAEKAQGPSEGAAEASAEAKRKRVADTKADEAQVAKQTRARELPSCLSTFSAS